MPKDFYLIKKPKTEVQDNFILENFGKFLIIDIKDNVKESVLKQFINEIKRRRMKIIFLDCFPILWCYLGKDKVFHYIENNKIYKHN